ncbi:MAG: hypothetical protein JWO54_847 [Candidatus Saccharibacteria bacterium]|nr:hypothetical protein [Candidatus Saccharibacteria bacterium]
MSIYKQDSENNTSGTAVATANSANGSNVGFGNVNAGLTYSNAQAAHGVNSISVPTSAALNGPNWPVSTADRTFAGRFYVYATGLSSTDFILAQLQVNGGLSARVLFQGTGKIRLTTAGSVQRWTAAITYPLNQWVRIEFEGNIGTTASNCQIRILYYLGVSTTPVDQSTWITGIDLGGANGFLDQIYVYKYGAGTLAGSIWEDDLEYRTGSNYTGLIGPVPSATAPVPDAGSYVIAAPGAQFTLDGSGSTGTITSRSWTSVWPQTGAPAPTLTGATTSSPSATAGTAGSVYVYQQTVTNAGGSDSDTVNVMVTDAVEIAGGSDLIWNGTAW